MPKAVVVIPVYKTHLSEEERLAFRQCLHILGRHPVVLVVPEKTDVTEIRGNDAAGTEVMTFDRAYFESIAGYNRLMTSTAFYKAFEAYEYMLVCQLDAYVFRDELEKWCDLGYDYIGAPAFDSDRFDKLGYDEEAAYSEALSAHRLVFNGGFSLRRIAAMIRLLRCYNFFFPEWKGNEDMLFSLDAARLFPFRPFMKLPHWKDALRFSFERSPAASYRLTAGQLPFGCHAWQRYDPQFWRNFIPRAH